MNRPSTSLHDPADSGVPLEVVDWLLARLPSITLFSPDVAGRVPVSIAVLRGTKWELVEAMLDRMKTKDAALQYGLFPDAQRLNLLHYAVMSQSTDMVTLLLDRLKQQMGVPKFRSVLEASDTDRWTPLHWACRRGNEEIVSLLVDSGANVTARTYPMVDAPPRCDTARARKSWNT